MKTVLQALKDEVHYKLSSGFFENRLLERSLDGNEICTIDILKSKPVQRCCGRLSHEPDSDAQLYRRRCFLKSI